MKKIVKITRVLGITIALVVYINIHIQAQNNCLNFDGSNDYLLSSAINPTNFTIEAWVYAEKTSADQAIISTLNESSLTGCELHIGANQTASLTIRNSSGWLDVVSASGVVSLNGWTHLAATYNGTTAILYANGILVGSTASATYYQGSSNLTLGQRSSGGLCYDGSIEDCRVWNYALSQTSIQNNMYATLSGSETGLLCYYKFNQGTAGGTNSSITTATDATANGYTGTLYNFALSGTSSNWVSGLKGEPVNHVSSFAGNYSSSQITLTWTDVATDPTPDGYYIYVTTNSSSYTTPVNGIEPTLDNDLTDGEGIVKVLQGVQTYNGWINETIGSTYYFRIYPYTSSGITTNYKTDGTIPEASVFISKAEPTNHATAFTSSINSGNIELSWTDAVGTVLPDGYLIMASASNSFSDPLDGTDITTDNDLADGTAKIKVTQGAQAYAAFTNIVGGNTYYFRIYPYTNSGTYIDYKTTVTVPNTSVFLPKSEPTNHATAFSSTMSGSNITLSWTDATGSVIPDGYLIMASKTNSFTDPTDGAELTDDTDLTDGTGSINVTKGVQSFNGWTNIELDSTYYFSIFPYTNSGIYTNYKTDETVPTAQATIPMFSLTTKHLGFSQQHAVSWGNFNNDNYFDVAVLGKCSTSPYVATELFANNGTLNNISAAFSPVDFGSLSWGDYNKDNYLDLMVTGATSIDHTSSFSGLYKNNGDSTFTLTSNEFPQLYNGATAFADFNKDGNLDILIAGQTPTEEYVTKIYQNNGNGSFYPRNEFILEGIKGTTMHDAKVIWADFNNDGYLDILLNSESKAYLYFYTSNPEAFVLQEDFVKRDGYDGFAFIDVGDFNNDNYLDILRTGCDWNGGYGMVYKNNGDGSFSRFDTLFNNSFYANSAFWADYDNDGYLDAIVDGKIYKNNQGNSFTFLKEVFSGDGPGNAVDVDNDGDLDFVYHPSGYAYIYKNNTLNRLPALTPPEALTNQTHLRQAMLSWQKDAAPHIRYALRVGTSPEACNIVAPQALANGQRLVPDYLNLLSDTTFIVNNLGPGTYYWSVQKVNQNGIGSPFQSEQSFIIDTIQSAHITSKYISNTSLQLKWKRGNGDGCLVFAKQANSGNAVPNQGTIYKGISTYGYGSQIKTGDYETGWYCLFNGIADSVTVDGLSSNTTYSFEVMEYFSRRDSDFYCYSVDSANLSTFGTSIFTERSDIPLTGLYYASSSWVDYDNDLDLDLVLSGEYWNGSIIQQLNQMYSNDGNQKFSLYDSPYYQNISQQAWGDFDRDGDMDHLTLKYINSLNNSYKLLENNGGTFSESKDLDYLGNPSWFDLNNDGWLDIVMSNKVYVNYGDSIASTPIDLNIDNSGTNYIVDYNNDGLLDIIVLIYEGGSHLYQNKGNFIFEEQADPVFKDFKEPEMAWADYNNDGFQDFIISYKSNGQYIVELYKNNNGVDFTLQNDVFIQVGANIFTWFDYNNDGLLDLFIDGYANSEYYSALYKNTQSGFVKTDIQLPAVNNGAMSFADYDNDGDLDFVICGQTNNGYRITKIFQNNTLGKGGVNYNSPPNKITRVSSEKYPGGVNLSWDYGNDNETPEKTLTYNLMLWNKDSSNYIIAPNADSLTGNRYISLMGNKQYARNCTLSNLKPATYKWCVQAIDGGFLGGAWSDTTSFTITDAQAYFTFDTVCLGLPTNFTDLSASYKSITAWKWNFGDTTAISTLQNPEHVYQYSGEHTVQLVVFNSEGKTDTITNTVLVKAIPIVTFTANDVCSGTTTVITNNTPVSNVQDWLWDFGDESTSTYANPGSHVYSSLGNYTITLTAEATNGCSSHSSQSIVVTTTPSAVLTLEYGSPTFCSGDSVVYSVPSDSNYSYQWQLNGENINNTKNQITVKTLSGNYQAVITNKLASTCMAVSAIKAITVNETPASPIITPESATTFCQGDSVKLNLGALSNVTVNWYKNEGNLSGNQLYYMAKESGLYTSKITNSYGCSAISKNPVNIVVNEVPALPSLTYGSTTICDGNSVVFSTNSVSGLNYQWKNNGASIIDATSNQYSATASGNYSLQLTNSNSCWVETPKVPVTVNSVPGTPIIDQPTISSLCSGDSVLLQITEMPDVTYQWYLNSGTVSSNSNELYAKASGTYQVAVYNSLNCSATSTNSINIVVNNKPTLPSVSYGNTTICQGNSVVFNTNSISGLNYQWKNNGANIDGATLNQYSAASSGKYSLQITNSSLCSVETPEVMVTVNSIPTSPVIDLPSTNSFCSGDSILLQTTYQDGLNWLVNGISTGISSNIIYAKTGGKYSVKVTNNNLCEAISTNFVDLTMNQLPTLPTVSTGETSICSGNSVNFMVDNNPLVTYQWYKNNEAITNATSNTLSTGTSGDYWLRITNGNLCSISTSPISVTVNSVPSKPTIIEANNNTNFCPGTEVELQVTNSIPELAYQWKRSGIAINGATQSNYAGQLIAGDYNVEVKAGGCANESEILTLSTKAAPPKPQIFARGPNVWILACDNTTASDYRWFYNDQLVIGAKTYIYTANQNLGNYYVEVNDGGECYTMSDIINIPSGDIINDITDLLSESITVYPNPTTDQFNVELGGILPGALNVDLVDALGKTIKRYQYQGIGNFYINISELPRGIYFCRIQYNANVIAKKIVKQ